MSSSGNLRYPCQRVPSGMNLVERCGTPPKKSGPQPPKGLKLSNQAPRAECCNRAHGGPMQALRRRRLDLREPPRLRRQVFALTNVGASASKSDRSVRLARFDLRAWLFA